MCLNLAQWTPIFAKKKEINMGNKATTIDQQIQKLRERGVIITDVEKAKENLLDIGYFRLCSYLFPFEKSYPKLKNRSQCKKQIIFPHFSEK